MNPTRRPNPIVATQMAQALRPTRSGYPGRGPRICPGTGSNICCVAEREAQGDFDYLFDDPADQADIDEVTVGGMRLKASTTTSGTNRTATSGTGMRS